MASRSQLAPAVPDEEIVRTFQETGSSDCFAELFARYRRKVFLACRGFFTDSAGAEDAVQETFLRAYQNMHRFQGGNFAGWLMQIARNICIDAWRKRRPEVDPEDTVLAEKPKGRAVESTTELRLAADQVWDKMKTLSPEQQQCLKMKIEGYSYEETAARTGLSVEAVKSHLQNGRRMLWLKMEGMLSQLQ
jgi:RNA polymerase sigma-70 factor (ECF subfamily)